MYQGGPINLQGGGGVSLQGGGSPQSTVNGANLNTTVAPGSNGYFWKGSNGQVYVQGSRGINAAGAWDPNTANYWSSRGFRQTADSPSGQPNTNTGGGGYGTNTTSGGGSGAAAPAVLYPDKSNDITLQNAGLGQVDSTQNRGIQTIEDAWNKINGQYSDDLNTAGTEYNNETTDNTKDLQTNKQTALERGVQGRQGLFGTLASIGALNGTGVELANHAVQQGANEDLTTAANTYATNQNSLDNGYQAYKKQEERLQSQAETAKTNNEEQVRNDAAKSRQQYLTNLANDYQAEGKVDQAKGYASQAAALFPSIAATNVPTINLGYSGGSYAAPTLSQYVGKANNTTVQTTPGSHVPGSTFNIPGLAALNKRQGA
jgi:hypothetical protein